MHVSYVCLVFSTYKIESILLQVDLMRDDLVAIELLRMIL